MIGAILLVGSVEIGDRCILIDSQKPAVGAHKSAVEYATGKALKVLLLEGAQEAAADLG